MRILFAADEQPYTAEAIPLLARLGENTWADITIIGVSPGLVDNVLESYGKQFLESFDPEVQPYYMDSSTLSASDRVRKQISITSRKGDPATAILQEAETNGYDLIAIGSSVHNGWENQGDVPLKVAQRANCPVLVIKGEAAVRSVFCCLDQYNITQRSIEMISQMVTLFRTELRLVVLTEKGEVDKKLERFLAWLIRYYSSRDIYPRIELVRPSSLERYITLQSEKGLMAMWSGKVPILERIFSGDRTAKLLKNNKSSVLVLK